MSVSYNPEQGKVDFTQFKHFKELSQFSFDVDRIHDEYQKLIEKVPLDPITNQICLTHTLKDYDKGSLFYEGCGSLTYAWSKDPYNEDGSLNKRKEQLVESDFTEFNDEIKSSYLFEVYETLSKYFILGRFRFFKLAPKKCMGWHSDTEPRIHIPVITDPGCKIVIENESVHLPASGFVYHCDTEKFHTALNGSHKCNRIHLVAGLVGKKPST